MHNNDFCSVSLGPMQHHNLSNHCRVPLYIDEETYILWVDARYSRSFYADELPNLLKSKIAMVLASPIKELFTIQQIRFNPIHIYLNKQYPELDEVGWRVTDKLLCLVLPKEIVNSLKGELLTKETI